MKSLLLFTAWLLFASAAAAPECAPSAKGSTSPHESHCDQYYRCFPNGTLALEQCKKLKMYDAQWGMCISPGDVDCSNRPYSDPTGKTFLGEQRPECKAGDPVTYWPHEYTCRSYYKCENGVETKEECLPRKYFDIRGGNPEELVCSVDRRNYATYFYCVDRPIRHSHFWNKTECTGTQKYFVEKSDCGTYWACYEGDVGRANQGTCSVNHDPVFDPTRKGCGPLLCTERKDCDMKDVLVPECPTTEEWEHHNRYIRPYTTPWQAQWYIDTNNLLPLKEPRWGFGHCRYYFECPEAEDGVRRPKSRSCEDGLVVEPGTLQCVPEYMVPECKDYWYYAKLYKDYENMLMYA